MPLKISDSLELPDDAVTSTFGLLAVRGAGKSNAARVMAEEMFRVGLPFIAIDPVGSWYGLRAAGDGSLGLPIPVFGGSHGDVPLTRDCGVALADMIAEKRLSCVIDLSKFSATGPASSVNDKKHFLLKFAQRLYERNTQPLHVFFEEADDYIPQRPQKDELQLKRAFEDIVRRGRSRGIGITLITQRSAVVDKNVLTQVETLIAMRTTGPQDTAAIRAWMQQNGTNLDMLKTLPSLESGEAWVWSPHFLKVLKRIKFRKCSTYDSGATPSAKSTRKVATLADISLPAITEQFQAAVAAARENDPAVLQARVRELEVALKRHQAQLPSPNEVKAAKDAIVRELRECAGALHEALRSAISTALASFNESVSRVGSSGSAEARLPITLPSASLSSAHEKPAERRAHAPNPGEPGLPPMTRAFLTTLAQHPAGLTKSEILTHTGYASSGPVSKTFAELTRFAHVAVANGRLVITNSGLAVLGDFEPLPTGRDLLAFLLNGTKLSGMEKKLLKCIADAYPNTLMKGVAVARAGYASSGPVSAAFARLTRMGYVIPERGSALRLSAILHS